MFTEKIKNSLDSIETFPRIFNKHEWTYKKSKPTFRKRFFLFSFFSVSENILLRNNSESETTLKSSEEFASEFQSKAGF